MNIGSKKNMMLLGFSLSLVSVAFNSVVISYVNKRLKEVDEERTSLSDSLGRQAAALSDADSQFTNYRMMHNLMYAVPREAVGEVENDSANQLGIALEKYYQAAYDIPQTEMTSADSEDFSERLPIMEKDLQLEQKWQAATSREEKAQLDKEHEDLQKQLPEPKSDLVRKVRELGDFADKAEHSDNEVLLSSALLPVMKSFQNEFVASSERKRSRIHELQAARTSLVKRSDYTGFGAIAFQLLGLMVILAKDLVSQRAT